MLGCMYFVKTAWVDSVQLGPQAAGSRSITLHDSMEWSSRALMWAEHKAERYTFTTPHFRLHGLLPHSHFPSRSDAAQGLARCLCWRSVGKLLREARMPATDFYPRGSLLSRVSLFQSHRRRSLQRTRFRGRRASGTLKHCDCFPTPSQWHQESIFHFVFGGYTGFLFFLCVFGCWRNQIHVGLTPVHNNVQLWCVHTSN